MASRGETAFQGDGGVQGSGNRSRSRLGLSAFGLAVGLCAPLQAQQALPSLAEPGISPDGTEIAFVSGGDIWTVPASGGQATLLVAHSAMESRPLYSPDGRWLAFNSDRDGNREIYLLEIGTGAVTRLTFNSATDQLDGWSVDGRWIYFTSSREDIAALTDVYRVSVEGGTPLAVLADLYADEFFAAPGPGGQVAISTRGRTAYGQWWRNGHSHMDEAEIWIAQEGAVPTYRAVSTGGKNIWPLWSGDGSHLYFMSDRGGAENLWSAPVEGGEARALTQFTRGRVLWPSVSRSGDVIAFERDFGVWTVKPGETPRPVPITLRGTVEAPRITHRSMTSDFSDFALSPDGKKVAFIARGDVFGAPSDDPGPAERVTSTLAPETDVVWAPDSRRVAYLSARDGAPAQVYLYDFPTRNERRLTRNTDAAATPVFAPKGDRLAYVVGGKELHVFDTGTNEDRVLARGSLGFGVRPQAAPEWSPDGRWLAYLGMPNGEFTNVFVVPAVGGDSRQVTFYANTFAGSIDWSADGSFLIFQTGQRTETGMVVRVDLQPRVARYREDAFRELFETEPPRGDRAPDRGDAEPVALDSVNVEIEFAGIADRASLITVGVDPGLALIAPDMKSLLIAGSSENQVNLYRFDIDDLASGPPVPKQLTATNGGKGSVQFGPEGKRIWFLSQGRISSIAADGSQPQSIAPEAELDIDFDAEKLEVLRAAWRGQRDGFYDATMHGADWDAVLRAFEPRVAGARTRDEMRRILGLMIGELNASHSGISGSEAPSGVATGSLGLRFDRAEYERDGRLRITHVQALGPAGVTGQIHVGDVLLAVNGTDLGARTNLARLLNGTVGERTELRIGAGATGASDVRTVVVKPFSGGADKQAAYREWVASSRAYVDSVSGGRLGYVHMADMGAGALQQLYLDLDTENLDKEGVVVDVRHNNGGFVNAYALDVLTRRSFMSMRPRGGESASSRHQLGQRAILAPTVLVTNQNTLSDGEDFTEGYRTLGLGTVVGEPTAGWIIYTSNLTLFDGTGMRMPFIEVRGADGEVMELKPRPVDVLVERPTGESYSGRDSQLDEAVRVLLQQIDGGGRR